MYDETGRGKRNFNGYYIWFWGQASQCDQRECCTTKPEVLEFHFYHVYKLRYVYFLFTGRHNGFPTSGLVVQHFR